MEISQSFSRRIICSHHLSPFLSSHVLENISANCLLIMDWCIALYSLHINISLCIIFIILKFFIFLFLCFYLIQIVVLRDRTIWFFLIFLCHFPQIYWLIIFLNSRNLFYFNL
jgi:hypothetical protein